MPNTKIANTRVTTSAASTIRADLYFQTKITDEKKIITTQYSHILTAGVITS
jgi:hypothetical protein